MHYTREDFRHGIVEGKKMVLEHIANHFHLKREDMKTLEVMLELETARAHSFREGGNGDVY